jgi:hypothetical protein
MKKTTLQDQQCFPGRKFSLLDSPYAGKRPEYMICYFNEQFENPVAYPHCDGGCKVVVALYTGKIQLKDVNTEILLFPLV